MKEKLRKRVYMHGGNWTTGLHAHVDEQLLPSDFGGSGAPTDLRDWVKCVMDAEEEYQHLWM